MPRCLLSTRFMMVSTEYSRHPELSTASYDTQLLSRRSVFGDSDFYSSGLIVWLDADIVVNAPSYRAICKEQGMAEPNLFQIIERQIEAFDPDVLYIQDLNLFQKAHLERLRHSVGLEGGRADCIAYSSECALATL